MSHHAVRSLALVAAALVAAACSSPAADGGRADGLASASGPLVTAGLKIGPDVSTLYLPTIVGGAAQLNPSYVTISERFGASPTGALVVERTGGDDEVVSGVEGCADATLPPHGTCENAYRLDCTAASEGAKSATFTVTDPASGAVAHYTVSGTCDPAPTGTAFLTQADSTNDYGAVPIGTQSTPVADLTVTNSGDGNTGTLVTPIMSDKIGDASFRFTGDCSTDVTVMAPGDSCSLGYNLDCRSPATPGPQSVKVLEFDPVSGSSVTITLTGSCACKPSGERCGASAICCSGTCSAGLCT